MDALASLSIKFSLDFKSFGNRHKRAVPAQQLPPPGPHTEPPRPSPGTRRNGWRRCAATRCSTRARASFDDITQLAAQLCGTPIALIALVDEARVWLKSRTGVTDTVQMPRDTAFCGRSVLHPGLHVVADTLTDPQLAQHPLGGPPAVPALLRGRAAHHPRGRDAGHRVRRGCGRLGSSAPPSSGAWRRWPGRWSASSSCGA